MGHSTLIIEAIKVTLVLCASLALSFAACPDVVTVECGKDMMNCPGLMDAAGCQMPNTCMPTKGPVGTDGTECAVTCPTAPCGKDMLSCPVVSSNGCPMPASCIPMKGGPVGTDGTECAATCPSAPCGKDMINCPVMSSNGCPMPDTCIPMPTGAAGECV